LVRGCDAVFHAAAFLKYGQAFRREHQRVNVEGTSVVAQACRRAGEARLVHVSSVAAIGLPEAGVPVDETFSFNADANRLSYHRSKRDAEVRVFEEIARGLDGVLVNPSSIVGPYEKGFRGANVPEGVRRRRIVPYFVGGTNVVHVDDVVEGMLAALQEGEPGQRYILGGENLSWHRMAQIAAEELGVRRTFVPVIRPVTAAAAWAGTVAGRLGRPARFNPDVHRLASRRQYYDSTKATAVLGYAHRQYREVVREYLDGDGTPSRARAVNAPAR
jgi:dihydroflavonol-4-reductase